MKVRKPKDLEIKKSGEGFDIRFKTIIYEENKYAFITSHYFNQSEIKDLKRIHKWLDKVIEWMEEK